MKIRRSIGPLSVLLGVSLSLGACSSGSTGDDSSALTLYSYEDAGADSLLKEQLAVFTEETGIEVELNNLPGSGAAIYPGRLRTALAGGEGPDVWRIWGGSLGSPLATDGLAADLADYWEQYDWDQRFPESARAGMTFDGATYGIPIIQNTVVVWYSKSAFEEAGITEEPTSYEDLVAANEKLVASGQVPLGTGGQFGYHVMRLFEYLLEKNAGAELHDDLLTGEASWDDPAVVQAFTEFKEWEEKGWLPEGVAGLDPSQEEPGFTQGRSAYTIAGGWADANHVQAAPDPSDYGVFKLPTGQEPNRHSGWVEGYMINEASPNKDDAAELLDWLSRPETLEALNIGNTSVVGAETDAEAFPLTAEVNEFAAESPFYTIQDQAFPAELSNAYYDIQSQVLQGQTSPEDAAKQMQQAVSTGLGQE